MVPAAGPSTQLRPTQALPQATYALLHTLAPVHSTHFPRLARAVHADLSEFATDQQRQDAEQKIALLKSVLGGWLQGVERDLEGNKDLADTTENLNALIETLPGSLSGIRAKPRLLVHTPRAKSTGKDLSPSARRTSLSPQKAAVGQDGFAQDDLKPDEDLATFLVPKCLGVCARLQATLLPSSSSSGQVDPAEATDDIVALRKSALAEVEAFLRGIIDTLAESALRLEWRGGSTKDNARRNGVGKAGEVVESMLNVVRALLPEADPDFQTSYPRTVRVLPSPATDRVGLRTPSKKADSEASLVTSQSTLVINSPAEAISIVLSSLRILIPVIKTSPYLAEYRPATVDLLARCFPTEDSLVPNASVEPSRKGKERQAPETLDALRDHILTGWIALACEMLDTPDAAGLFEVQVVARLILAELHSRVIDPLADHTMDIDAAESAPRAASEVEVWLLTALAKIWSLALRREAKGSGLQELLQYSLVILAEAVTSLIELDGFSQVPQSAQTLLISFAMCLPAALGWTSSDPDSLDPDEFTSTFFASLHAVFARLTENENVGAAARDAIAAACGAARAAAVQIHSVDMVAMSADEAIDFDASPRKRRRIGEKEEELTRAQVGADGQPTAEASRQHRDAVRRLVSQALAWARHEAEKDVPAAAASILAAGADDSAEHTMLRYIAALPSASAELGYHLARTIGLLSCAKNNCLALVAADDFSAPTPSCAVCDADERSSTLSTQLGATRALTKEPLEALLRVFQAYLSSTKHEQAHLGALDMLRRLVNHSVIDHPLIKSSNSPILRMVKPDLEHGRRSIRSAAGSIIVSVAAVQQSRDANGMAQKDLLELVDGLLGRGQPALSASALQLAGQLLRVAEPQGVLECESLARLLRGLGDRNSFIKLLVKQEITQAAAHRDVRPYFMLSPHLPALSSILVSSMSIIGGAMDVFHQSREALLRVTREHILPDLVLQQNDALLQEVAKVSNMPVAAMLCEPIWAASILAHLFTQGEQQRKASLEYLVRACRGILLSKLIESVHVPLVFRLALNLGDDDPKVVARAHAGLIFAERIRLGHSANTKIDIADTLRSTIVGLLSHMNRGLQQPIHQSPLRDKQKIIRSLDAITRLVGRAISGFSPQIMATLQTALDIPGLRLVTLNAFRSFISSLKFADIGPFVGPMTAAFVRLWPELEPRERDAACATINYIVVDNADNLARNVKDVADLSGIPELASAHRRVQAVQRNWSFLEHLEHLLNRVASENEGVMLQGLRELRTLLSRSTKAVHQMASGDAFDPSLSRLIAVLLSASARDGLENEMHRNLAFECIGIIGAVDPDRFELPPVEQPPVVIENFLDTNEAIRFALRLIVDLLVGAYRSTNDTKHQELLAFAIQELLRFCKFTGSLVMSKSTATVDDLTKSRWESLPKSVMEACAPLLTTRFSLSIGSIPEMAFPIYTSTSTYRDWIRSFANELLKRVTAPTAKQVFAPFSGLLHLEDTAIAQYLLPHLVLHILISGRESDREAIRTEIATILQDQVSPTHILTENSRLLSAQTVFSLMDHLSRWITLAKKLIAEIKSARKKSKKERPSNEREIQEGLLSVEGVLQDVPHVLVGQAALTCKAYARSLLNFESHIVAERRKKGPGCDKDLQVYYENLHECYAHLDEPDGMEGISTRILAPSVLHQIREHESTGRWTSAQSCWEVKLQQKPDDPANHVGLLRCLRNLGHYDTMRTHILGLFASRGDEVDWERVLAPYNIEASLFVGDWEAVENALDVPGVDGPEAAFGRALCAMRSGDQTLVESAFYAARESLGGPIVAAGRESYRRVYDSVVHLHILDDLQRIQQIQVSGSSDMPALASSLSARLHASAPTFRAREPILNHRRIAFSLAAIGDRNINAEVGSLWLETSKIARKAGHFQTAYSAILQARDCHADFAFFQSAKLFKANDQTYKAIQELDNAISPILATINASDPRDPHIVKSGTSPLAKAALCRVRWMIEAGRLEINEAASLFTEVERLAPLWENAPYYLGRFWDNQADEKEKKPPPRGKQKTQTIEVASYRVQTVKLYLAALNRGTKFIFQTLPRTLTIWLELGERPGVLEGIKTKPADSNDGESHELSRSFRRTNRYIKDAANAKPIPTYLWLTVLPQVVSRILHTNAEVLEVLEIILKRVLASYPHHGYWAMASGAKSTTARRSKRNMRVFAKAKEEAALAKHPGDISLLIDEGLKLVEQLLVLCNFAINEKTDSLSLKKTFPNLQKICPTKLIIPLQSSLTVSLPYEASQAATHKPFPDNLPTFHAFDDQILVMSSLQKPRKITVRDSQGRSYGFLCKPKDDLRKDARLMEFNSMIIKLLKKDSDARSRKLNIRTYSVVPLNEECGLIEWVPHVVVLRGVLSKRYAAMNISAWSADLKRVFDTIRNDPKLTAERFETEVLKNFPSVFHEWFLENFPEPSAWHRARLAYSRTAAVISMVGFVLGLGDRHCENILLDGTTGDTVHVDFNCLFDKGRTFEVPERVPFRLTHNIIDGMGVTGVEGVYRRSAEITLRILRANKDSLRSVLETFLHDPLVEWVHSSRKRDSSLAPDQTKARALEALEPISNKLMGLQVTSDPESLGPKEVTIEEQVERLIREARNPQNLGSMYVGWCAWF